MKKIMLFFVFIFLVGCSDNEGNNEGNEVVAEPLMNQIPTTSIYNLDNEELKTTSFAVCWNYCDESDLPPANDEGRVQNIDILNEVESGETLEIVLKDETPHNVSHQLITYSDSGSTEEELNGNTFEVDGTDENRYAVVTRYLNDDDETIGQLQTMFSVGIK